MKTNYKISVCLILSLLLSLTVSTAFSSSQNLNDTLVGTTALVSVASDGTPGNSTSENSSISADGRYVAFSSYATNLVNEDTNESEDVFVRDQVDGKTTRVSVTSDGIQGNARSYYPAISADGRYVAFASYASNLVVGDTNRLRDIFVHDRGTGETTRVSVASDGTQGNGSAFSPSISTDGRYVAFESKGSNLVVGDTNGFRDIFVHDREDGETQLVSVASNGIQGNNDSGTPSISADGLNVAIESDASNLVDGDTNGYGDIFVHNLMTGETTLVSVASNGIQGNNHSGAPSISVDGRYVAFSSLASNLVDGDTNNYCDTDSDNIYDDNCLDIFVHNSGTGETERVSISSDGTQGNDQSSIPAISSDGLHVVFLSYATNLVEEDTNNFRDVFVHDWMDGQTTRVSVAAGGTQGNGSANSPSISNDGRYVAFESSASNLVFGGINDFADVFVHDREGINFRTYLPITRR